MTIHALATGVALAIGVCVAWAGGFAEPPVPPIGTKTVATADLYVKRPPTTPCVVTLFDDHDFIGFDPYPFSYAPPADCPGPWSKVVLQADLYVTAGVQYDRTAVIDIGGINVYFGTTMEPSGGIQRNWHVERDVTDVAATLMTAQTGEAILYNVVNQQYTGHVHAAATLAFYPPGAGWPARETAQTVIPMAPSLTALSPTNPVLSKQVTLPQNTERLYMDVIAQSQASDEFWYTCVPDQYAAVLQSCGGGPFREVDVSIDGTVAGFAPVFPWIYSGGINPNLWTPTPGVETLNFKPYRIDLTPFAGQLDDGMPHTVSLQVFGAQDNFSVSAALLAFGDPGSQVVTGGLVSSTLALPVVGMDARNLRVKGQYATGGIQVWSGREALIIGKVNTSHGTITTQLYERLSFTNFQHFHVLKNQYQQRIFQHTQLAGFVLTSGGPNGTVEHAFRSNYPLMVNYLQSISGGQSTLDESITQERKEVERLVNYGVGGTERLKLYDNTVSPHIHRVNGVGTMTSAQHLFMKETGLGCYNRTISVTANAVSAVEDRCTP